MSLTSLASRQTLEEGLRLTGASMEGSKASDADLDAEIAVPWIYGGHSVVSGWESSYIYIDDT